VPERGQEFVSELAQQLAPELMSLIGQYFALSAFESEPAVTALTPDDSALQARRDFQETRGVPEIDGGMRARGLVRMIERARSYTPVAKTRSRIKTISVIPYSSPDPESPLVGGMGLSEGEPANSTERRSPVSSPSTTWTVASRSARSTSTS
jgi:hypothetical protein